MICCVEDVAVQCNGALFLNFAFIYWTAHIRSQAEAWKAEALIGFSVVKTSVCLCVCSQATGHSFWPRNLIFWHNTPWDMRKKHNFLFFEILIFGPLRALFRSFSSIFFFILCKSSVRATSHTDRLTNLIFGTGSLYDTITWGFQRFLKICICVPFRGPFIFKKGPKSQKT